MLSVLSRNFTQSGPVTPMRLEPCGLQTLAVPAALVEADDEEDSDLDLVGQLIETVPGLEAKLNQLTAYPEQVLPMLLAGHAQDRVFGPEDAVLAGGAPALIQSAHDPLCTACQQPMRFLFQFDDVTEDFKMGDCGVGYIYGCDAHPEHCRWFVDCY
ncbi:hypothetical protein [Pseudoxanthomonas wuyuanensis]